MGSFVRALRREVTARCGVRPDHDG